jgi:hypothetical protein
MILVFPIALVILALGIVLIVLGKSLPILLINKLLPFIAVAALIAPGFSTAKSWLLAGAIMTAVLIVLVMFTTLLSLRQPKKPVKAA